MQIHSNVYGWSSLMLIVAVYFGATCNASAYIDPGSSSYFFQLLIAGLTGIVFFFSSIKRRARSLFKKRDSASEDNKDAQKPTVSPSEESSASH